MTSRKIIIIVAILAKRIYCLVSRAFSFSNWFSFSFLRRIISFSFWAILNFVSDILVDIELFYSYIRQNGQITDEWYLSNMFTYNYWSYFQANNWLSPERENFLHQGILNFILFMSYQYLDNKGNHIEKISQKAFKSIYIYTPQDKKTEELKSMVINTLIMVEKKKRGDFDIANNSEIFKSITWTLQNTILNMDSQLIEDKDKNQR